MAEREGMSARGFARFVLRRYAMNLKAGFEYRASFWSQVLFMLANNAFLLWFWQIFFHHFGSVRAWRLEDMYLLYGVSATAFGLASVFAGNSLELAGTIADGELDYYIGLPPPTLPHALITRLRVSAIGDLLFGAGLLLVVFRDQPERFILALLLCVPAALVFVAVSILGASLSFYVGESRGISFQLINLLVTFSTYPEAIFQGTLRWVMYLLIPAGFFSYLPVAALRAGEGMRWVPALELLGGACAFVWTASWVFHRGLKRYSSGSSMGIRI